MNFIVKPLIRKRSASFAGHFLTPQQISLRQSRAQKRMAQKKMMGGGFQLKTFFNSHHTLNQSLDFLRKNIFDVSFFKQSIFLFSSFARSFKKIVSLVSHHDSGGGFSYSTLMTEKSSTNTEKNDWQRAVSKKSPFGILFGWSDAKLISELLSDKDKFNAFVYTPWRDAISELNSRVNDRNLEEYLHTKLPYSTPQALRNGKNMVLARQLATPNYEMYRFIQAADVTRLRPLILEYRSDKYVNNNELKYALAKLRFFKGIDSDNKQIVDYRTIIDRNSSNGVSFDKISTKQGDSFVEFHRSFFLERFPFMPESVLDSSEMYAELGGKSKNYYKAYLSLFLRNSVLFETFLTYGKEAKFTEKIFLPAMISVMRDSGVKPLIVNLGPFGNEDDIFWTSYPAATIEFVDKYINK